MNEMDKVDVLVATPLRLKGLIEKKRVSLSAVRYLVLDEADKLFEMGRRASRRRRRRATAPA